MQISWIALAAAELAKQEGPGYSMDSGGNEFYLILTSV
jgi:hypothetical protein